MLSYACYNILMIEFIELIKVFLLSVIQGVTEWLPVSSTGHMILLDDNFSTIVTAVEEVRKIYKNIKKCLF